jgi:hypothetical protein
MLSCSQAINDTQRDIHAVDQPPPQVLQPLPMQENRALPVLFFLQMPETLRVFSRLSFTVQQMLLPRAPLLLADGQSVDVASVNAQVKVNSFETGWVDYYMRRSTDRAHQAVHTNVRLGALEKVSQNINKSTVRYFSTPSDGVWHPDSLTPRLFWNGGDFPLDSHAIGYFNPFAPLSTALQIATFTEPLKRAHTDLQWAVHQSGSEALSSRGNVAEATQGACPDWLPTKASYLAFGALRVYPHQQMRKLCLALAERSLPLGEPAVKVLIQSAMYHLGELSTDAGATALQPAVQRRWRTDLESYSGWDALRHELDKLADELRMKARDHGAVLLQGELAAHASQWDAQSRLTARHFARTAQQWAEDTVVDEGAPPEQQAMARSRRCLFSMYGIVCHGAGELSVEDVGQLCELVVMADYSRLFEEPCSLDQMMRDLTAIPTGVVARRLPEIADVVAEHPHLLTAAVRRVLQAQTPEHLDWRQVSVQGTPTGCYEAAHGTHLFSLNLLTGVVSLPPVQPQPSDRRRFTRWPPTQPAAQVHPGRAAVPASLRGSQLRGDAPRVGPAADAA